mmetsp:Transcript_4142/g.10497  ORF Transcript_4142/g.10497 Transcript_4142/m.10497 type:complete len:232 (+) Transcript_4142:268-963(+)
MATRPPRRISTPSWSATSIKPGLKTRSQNASDVPLGCSVQRSPLPTQATPLPSAPKPPAGTAQIKAACRLGYKQIFTFGRPGPAAPGRYAISIGYALRLICARAAVSHLARNASSGSVGSASPPLLPCCCTVRSSRIAPRPLSATMPEPGMSIATPRPAASTLFNFLPSKSNMRRNIAGKRFVEISASFFRLQRWSAGKRCRCSHIGPLSSDCKAARTPDQATSTGRPTCG